MNLSSGLVRVSMALPISSSLVKPLVTISRCALFIRITHPIAFASVAHCAKRLPLILTVGLVSICFAIFAFDNLVHYEGSCHSDTDTDEECGYQEVVYLDYHDFLSFLFLY